MNIVVFSTVSCPYCKMVKDYLISKNVSFIEKMVDQNDEARLEMAELSGGFLGVPFTVITKDDGVKENVIGFDKGKLEKILS